MSTENQPPNIFLPSLRRLLVLSGTHKRWFFIALFFDLVLAILVVLQSHYFRMMFDAIADKDRQEFFLFVWISLGIGVANIPLSYALKYSLGWFSESTLSVLRDKVAAHLNQFPVASLEERHSGDFLSVINADLGKIKSLTGTDLLGLSGQVLRGLSALIYIFLVSWQLTLVSLVMTPLMFLLLSKLNGPIISRTQKMQEKIGALNSVAQDGLNGMVITKSFNFQKVLDKRFEQVNQSVIRIGLSIARLRSGVDVIGGIVGFAPFLIAFGYGGYLAISGKMTFGAIFAFINLLNYVVNPLESIPGLIAQISESIGAAQRIFEVLDHDLERSSGTVTKPSGLEGTIVSFKNLSFAYEANAPVLKRINFDIRKGESIAIVGPSGSGKSTLLKLILGFYPVENGSLYLFNHDINHWQLEAARQQMAFVAQDTYLFPVSVKENIACGGLEVSQDRIVAAAAAANIDGFIQSLPQGYQTAVGERGARLSGGQRQRISLARAVLKDAPILLLDEPTSALDSESEAFVQEALDRFMAEHTSIVVAHRLSTIKNADRVLVLDRGEIVEEGTHDELMERGTLYRELYEKQFGMETAQTAEYTGGG